LFFFRFFFSFFLLFHELAAAAAGAPGTTRVNVSVPFLEEVNVEKGV